LWKKFLSQRSGLFCALLETLNRHLRQVLNAIFIATFQRLHGVYRREGLISAFFLVARLLKKARTIGPRLRE
jgi:hypothetical protein